MATSGSTDFTLNRDQVISGALRKLGVLVSGGSPTTNQVTDATQALNALVKAFQADGMPLWAITNYTFTNTLAVDTYTIGVGQTLNTAQPLKVIQAFYTVSGQAPISMNVYNRYDYNLLPISTNVTGIPVNLYYQPLRTTGIIKLWPTPIDATTTVTIHYQRPFEDMDNATDDFDFPAYWIQALIYNLAWVLAPEYGIAAASRGVSTQEASYWKNEALSYGTEEGSLYMMPDRER